VKFVHLDITKSEHHLTQLFEHHKIQFVFNYAAHPYIPDSFERPLHVFEANANGALHVINAAQTVGVKRILQVSSAEIYGESYSGSIDESAPIVPHSSYGAAKAAIDAMVQVRFKEANTPAIALRQFNCIGPRETHPYIVPEIISQLASFRDLNTEPTIQLGNNSRRDFLAARDAVRIAVLLLEKGTLGEVYNLGSEQSISIFELAHLISSLMGFSSLTIQVDTKRIRPWEIWHLQSNNTKIRKVIGDNSFPQLTPLREALNETIRWFDKEGEVWPWQIL
jgi:nucleoside-diphosphate-sugar epimerase